MAQHSRFEEPVAVVGSACRFPGASSSPSKLWDLLKQPRNVLREFDPEHLNLKRFYHEDGETHGATNVTNKSYLLEEDSRLFDASFFGISPVEAAGMDPQQRLLLETVFEAMEQAGTTLEAMKGSRTSVHVGVMTNDWLAIQLRDPETVPQYAATGTANSIMSNRISYVFDFKGPSVTIDTACSSSLVALHYAAGGLRDGDSDVAIVAGVNLIFDPLPFVTESKLHMLSPDAQSRMWDRTANGYARGEGAAALLLKPLSKALRDGDHIEGVVRSTGVNSDGQSPGITMPFTPTQAELIRQTYHRAGLDPVRDRPQYFECHGTGTPAGDPVEARAVSETFVTAHGLTSDENPLYVGSIKTVIGHLEGCAGLAGVLKVLLAIKHRTIPPNLLFNELNADIAPFYGPLQIPTTAVPWPELPVGTPARASVNSFGFGGTNAHAIIESFDPLERDRYVARKKSSSKAVLGPLLFSAGSGPSLLRTIRAYVQYLHEHPETDCGDLSWVLQTRRTIHRVRAYFTGTSRDAILQSMESWVATHEKVATAEIGYQPRLVNPREAPGILGIFTGQGAQWPEMGRQLMDASPLFRRTMEACEAVLRALPAADAPSWSLTEQLALDASSSQLSKAALAQPLCTAVQLGLVELLRATGIRFDAVVGHSSGEIAATYAAGIINLQGAMQIAYYRGFHARLAGGSQGQKGAMLAVGLSLQKAAQFCSQARFRGRLLVAASNAPQNVTLSGDIDAVLEAKAALDEDSVSARQLKVDTAYHSHHMFPCAEPYLASLRACNIQVSRPAPGKCVWNSSVRANTQLLKGSLDDLKGLYWVANMVQTVLFSQAVESAIWHGGPFDVAVEVGPHPALKGPTERTLKAAYGHVPLYTGVLKRGGSDIEVFSGAMAAVWAQLGPSHVDFAGYRSAFCEPSAPPLAPVVIKGLPSYSWDHDKVYWRESRISRRYRLDDDARHELLGRRTPDDNQRELRWRNVLKLNEIPWVRGHEVLDEVLLPGAAYVGIAVEAGKRLAAAQGKSARLLEVENVDIHRPLVVPDDRDGVETLFTAHILDSTPGEADVLRARFAYYVCPDAATGTMVNTCEGELAVHVGAAESPAEDMLPPRETANAPAELVTVDADLAYSMFAKIGLKYTGAFRAIDKSVRCLDYAYATARWDPGLLSSDYAVHPTMLDVAFQTLFLARAHPASGQIATALLPSHIRRVRVDPSVHVLDGPVHAAFETWATKQAATSLTGDLNIYDAASGRMFVQVEGLATNTVGGQDAAQDRPIFAKTVWTRDTVVSGLTAPKRDADKDSRLLRLTAALERASLFYTKRLLADIGGDDRTAFRWHHQRMLEAFEGHLELVAKGQHPVLQSSWLDDDEDMLREADAAHLDSIELKFIHAIGNNIASVVRGQANLLEIVNKDDLLNRFYMEDSGCIEINGFVARAAKEIAFKFPHCNMLEIGAGTGGTTWSVLNQLEDAYDSYTYTDISAGFFANAAQKFADFANKMVFKTLDIGKEPASQGFVDHTYDIVIAANVLHATHNLQTTLHNVRQLLRPGGYLLLFETTGVHTLRVPFCFGGFEGWWLGEEPERRLRPIVSGYEWDAVLQDSGFSGVDSLFQDVADKRSHTLSLIASQAVDTSFLRLREPIFAEADAASPPDAPLLLLGGSTLTTSKLLAEVRKLLPRAWRPLLRTAAGLEAFTPAAVLSPGTDVLCVCDIDEPLLAGPMTDARMAALQTLLMNARNLLWVTSAETGRGHAPRASMFRGIARVMPTEVPQLQVQVLGLELDGPEPLMTPATAARHCAEAFLRLRLMAMARDNDDALAALWAHEPEIEILADGQTVIPRVVADHALNEVYLASKGIITKTVTAADVSIRAVPDPGKMTLQIANDIEAAPAPAEKARIRVRYALHLPSQGGGPLHLVCGDSETSPVVAISSTNGSIVGVLPDDDVVSVGEELCRPESLAAIAKGLLVQSISLQAAGCSSVLLYEANEHFAAAVAAELSAAGIQTCFASSHAKAPEGTLKIHPRASKRAVERLIPCDVGLFIDCSSGRSPASQVLKECMPSACVQMPLDASILRQALLTTKPSALLEQSCCDLSTFKDPDVEVIAAAALTSFNASSLAHKTYVVDWRERGSLLVTTPALNAQRLLHPDKTYFMVGAAGGLGMSICQWMIRNGARNMVIASRNPQLSPGMLDDARRAGATVRVVVMDVSQRVSVERAVREVRETMPPLGGVCNAAMVLSDKLFLDMDAAQLNGTLAGKVDGTEHLDAVLGDTPLDFFVVLSSSATTVGNIGQANYHCANLFMASLVAQRRARGLAGSIIHVGYVCDVGYVTRNANRQLDQHFHNMRLMALSETDVHHAFAEAIRGGNPLRKAAGADTSYDIIMGLQPASDPIDPDTNTPWLANPRFGYFVPSARLAASEDGAASSGSLRQQLESGTASEEEVAADVLEAFCGKLGAILQLPVESVKDNAQRPIIDLGIDSLVAVEIRTWFLKELGAEVPVVKILGGDTPVQVCMTATKKVLARSRKTHDAVAEVPTPTPAPVPAPTHGESHERKTETTSTSAAASTRSSSPSTETNLVAPSDLSSPPTNAHKDLGDDSTLASEGETSGRDSPVTKATSVSSEDGELSAKAEINKMQGKSPQFFVDDDTAATAKPDIIRQERMSPAQSRIWFLTKHLEEPVSYNMVFHYRAAGPVSISRLKYALQTVTQHHECLRMCFFPRARDGQPMQGLMAASAYELKHLVDTNDATLKETIAELKMRTWDLEAGRTLALVVLSRTLEQHDLVFGYHHIVTDVIGFHAFMKDLDTAYRMKPLDKKAAGSHLDYSAEQLCQLASANLEGQQLAFWQSEFAVLPEMLPLLSCATASARPAQPTASKSHHEYRELSAACFAAVKDACRQLRITPLHLHLAVLQVFLARYAGVETVCVGIVDANRRDSHISQMVGCFVNMLPVLGHVEPKSVFADIARAASHKALAAFDHAAVPIDKIIDHVKAPRVAGTAPLFQAALNYRTGAIWDLPLGADCSMQLSLDDGKDAEVPYDISLGVSDTATGCAVELHCQADLYSRGACHNMLDAYMRLLHDIAANPTQRVGDCALYDKERVGQALVLGSGPAMDFAWPPTLSERVMDNFSLYTAEPAIRDGNTTLSYAKLGKRVDAAAEQLFSAGCGPGSPVALLCEPSIDAVVYMLAILQIGAIYVPLDVSLPTARHAAMIKNCLPTALVTHAATAARARNLLQMVPTPVRYVCVDAAETTVSSQVLATCAAEPHAPAILLYTSGSTGTPKGVRMAQANFVNQIALHTHLLGLSPEVVSLQQSSLGFDMSLMQIFVALANGGCLVIAPAAARRDPVELTSLIARHGVSFTIATPSEYLAWLRYEITAAATSQHIPLDVVAADRESTTSAVGRALPNYTVRIVDAAGQPLPTDHVGEICVGGAGVVVGYLNLPEETQHKFVKLGGAESNHRRLYRTGDKGKLTPDGVLHCLGRLDGDTQVKLRGLRIDCQEVEGALLQAAGSVLSAAVVSRRGDILVAHATPSSERQETIDDAELSNVLKRLDLPQSFIPATIIIVPTLPVTANGKLDRKAVAALPLPERRTAMLNSSSEMSGGKMTIREGEVRLLWERVLPDISSKTARIGPDSDFFLCGGNSLLLMKLQAAIKESLGMAVPTRLLYRASKLRDMTNCIHEQRVMYEAEAAAQKIDWDAETMVPAWMQEHVRGTVPRGAKKRATDGLHVLLTGATTFLGSQLLLSLIDNPAVGRVHCIAVPADDQHLLPRNAKVECYAGSLLEGRTLGLSPAERSRLEQTVDVAVHAGAHGHCLNTYSSLRVPNVLATQALAALTLRNGIPLLFLSTSRVVLLSGDASPLPRSLAGNPPPIDGSDGYTASKWAGEVFLEKLAGQIAAAESRPWPVAIHRPCVVVGEQAPNSDALNAILRFSVSLRCVPKLARLEGYIDFGKVEAVAAEIAEAALALATDDGNKQPVVRFRHHSGGAKVPAADLARHLENIYGGKFDEIDMAEWMDRAANAGMDPLITAYLEGILHGDGSMVFPYMGEL
ncbi:hypothetical protein DL767_010583 [Monosporascus sp. MG133]|nr:hypothetical protein DL767_010583 [Monosporascus sp. MG133]